MREYYFFKSKSIDICVQIERFYQVSIIRNKKVIHSKTINLKFEKKRNKENNCKSSKKNKQKPDFK